MMRRTGKIVITPVLVLLLGLTAACAPAEAEVVKGILQNVDSVNGKVTIVTKDGKTVTVEITTETEVKADGTGASLETLEPGASVDIEVKKDGRAAQRIKARQAEAEGIIGAIKGNEVTIETEQGKSMTILVTDSTRIKFEGDLPGTLADLGLGMNVEAKFDPSTRLALKIEVEKEEIEVGEEEEAFIPPVGAGWGIIEIRVTDPGPANVKSAVVYLKNIEVHKVSANASDNASNASGWIPIIGAPPSFDLMDVIGVEQVLGSANITAGIFTQIRMDVERVDVVTTTGGNFTAQVPSDKLKIVGAFNVGGGKATVLTLDFDGEKSLIVTGKGKALFQPVVKLQIEQGKLEEGGSPTERGKPEDKGKP